MTAIAPPKPTWRRRFCLAFFLFFSLSVFNPCPIPAAQDLSSPDQVFQVEGRAAGPHHLEVIFRIADGNYLYRHKLKFEIHPPEIQPGEFQLPAGRPKEDPVFGRIEIYRQSLQVRIPISRPIQGTAGNHPDRSISGLLGSRLLLPSQKKKNQPDPAPQPPGNGLENPARSGADRVIGCP